MKNGKKQGKKKKDDNRAPDPEEVLKRLGSIFTLRGAMDLTNPFATIVGVLLSARTRDEQVLLALPDLLYRFPTPQKMADASVEEIQSYIQTIGMNGQKAKHLKGLATRIRDVYGGEVPNTMEELITLPGVGRKTASVVLSVVHDTPAIAVDVHVHRLANRLNWSKGKTPQSVEKDLLQKIPLNMHNTVNRVFVKLGRYICLPANPRCTMCPLQDICPLQNKEQKLPKSEKELTQIWKEKEENLQNLRYAAMKAHQEGLKNTVY